MKRLAFALLMLLVATTGASAQGAGAQAEVLFRQGKELMTAGKIPEACAAFDESQRLDPAITTLMNQANCREKNNQLATAWGLFLEVDRAARVSSDQGTQALRQVAKERATKLEARVSKLTVNVPAAAAVAELRVLRDTSPVEAAAWNRQLPIDGGTYKITASAPGKQAWSTTITVGVEADAKVVDIPVLVDAPEAPAQPIAPTTTTTTTTTTTPEPPVVEEPSETSRRVKKVLPIALGASGIALLGTGLVFELWGRSLYETAQEEPDGRAQDSYWQSANNKRYGAQAFAIGGVALVGVGVFLFIKWRDDDDATSATSLRITPTIAPGHAGIGLSGAY